MSEVVLDVHLLEVDHLTMRFGGLVAIHNLSFVAKRNQITVHHRAEWRGQDHRVQLPDGFLQAAHRRAAASPMTTAGISNSNA